MKSDNLSFPVPFLEKPDAKPHSFSDILIIGGGLSGLSAAYFLTQSELTNNLSISLLESRERVGGRSFSIPVSNSNSCGKVDLGGQWIGPNQSYMLKLIENFNLMLEDQCFTSNWTSPPFAEMYNVKLYDLSNDEIYELDQFEIFFDNLCKSINLTEPWTLDNAEMYDNVSLYSFLKSYFKSEKAFIHTLLYSKVVLSSDPNDCSFLFFVFYVASGGGLESLDDGPNGAQKWKIIGGSQQVSENLLQWIRNSNSKFHIHFNSSVTKISRSCTGNFLVESSNNIYEAKYIIMALSPLLAVDQIEFGELTISTAKKELYERFQRGKCVKIIIIYQKDTHFWDNGNNNPINIESAKNFLIHNLYHTTIDDKPGLIALITGNDADIYSQFTLDQAKSAIFSQLAFMYGSDINSVNSPLQFIVMNWCNEEFSPGCYANSLSIGTFTNKSYQNKLRNFENNMFWAGTETASEWYGYMEGAVRSGERVAKEISSIL